jgi:predicted acyl esterase
MFTAIPVTVRLPSNAKPGMKFPTILTIYGLDGHRLEHTMPSSHHVAHGWASVAVEIPGTGDCPADPNDPSAPERLWTSVLEWMREQPWIDSNRIAAWGVSCGGYYAIRLAHTHKDLLLGVVAQGAGCHHMFDPEWLEITRFMEYHFE